MWFARRKRVAHLPSPDEWPEPKDFLPAYPDACAIIGGQPPENLKEFSPRNVSQEQKNVGRCPKPFWQASRPLVSSSDMAIVCLARTRSIGSAGSFVFDVSRVLPGC